MDLKPMTEFIQEIEDYILESDNRKRALDLILGYNSFLIQEVEMNMFIPCNKEGLPLNKPLDMPTAIIQNYGAKKWAEETAEYEEAMKKVLFEGFKECDRGTNNECVMNGGLHLFGVFDPKKRTRVEDLIKYNLRLTPAAQEQIGL